MMPTVSRCCAGLRPEWGRGGGWALGVLGGAIALEMGMAAPAIGQGRGAESLYGTWDLVAWEASPDPRDRPLSLTFDGRGVSGSGGCNRYRGSYTVSGNQLAIGPLGSTRRACPVEIMERESRYLEALGAVETYELDGRGRLRLTYRQGAASGTLVFASPPVPGLW